MASEVILKKSSVVGKVPQLTDLQYGQVAINYSDCKMYFKTADNQIQYFVSPQKISGEGLATPTYIDFDVASTATPQRGRLWYNSEDDTLNLGHDNGVVQQIGQEFFVPPCLNNSGVEIANGSFVMSTGSQGDKITIAKAVTDGTYAPEHMLGIATHTVAIGTEFADIVINGIVRDLDTSLWPVGTLLYPNPAVPGGLTSTKPDAPAIRTPIAIVLRQHAVTGRIYVRMAWASKLGDTDSNVKFTSLANEDLLVYESSTGLWKNATIASLGRVAGSTSGGFVRYNGTTNLAGTLYGGTTTPDGTTRLNYSGYFYPTAINLAGTGDTSTASTHYFVETGTDGFVRPKTLANVQSEIVTTSVLGSGTANSTTFLRGDRTWAPFTGATMHVGVTPPADPQNGNLWWNTEIGRLLVYYVDGDSSQWVDASPSIEGPAGVGVPSGGTTGQALVKSSNLDYETEWADIVPKTGGDFSGNVSMPSINSGPLAGFKNRIINGNMVFNQRGASSYSQSQGYTLDRWLAGNAGTPLTVSPGSATSWPFNWINIAGTPGNTAFSLSQRISSGDIRDLANKQVTLSCYFYDSTSTITTGNIIIYTANAVDNFSSVTEVVSQPVSLSPSSGGRHVLTVALPDSAKNGVIVMFYATNVTAGNLVVHSVQLEQGPFATPFEFRHIGIEKSLCEWYFRKIDLSGLRLIGAAAAAGYHLSWVFSLSGPMRTAPSWSSILTTSSKASISTGPLALDSTTTSYVIYVISSAASGLVDLTFSASAAIFADAEFN